MFTPTLILQLWAWMRTLGPSPLLVWLMVIADYGSDLEREY